MPLIEGDYAEMLSIGRIGIHYRDVNARNYSIDSERVLSDEYDIAVYIDSLVEKDTSIRPEGNLQDTIFSRVNLLAKKGGIRLRFFRDGGVEFEVPSECIKIKLELNEDTVIRDKVLDAVKQRDLGSVKEYLAKFPFVAQLPIFGSKEESILHHACFIGDLELCQLLIQFGMDLNIEGVDKETPLVRAASEGHKEVVEFLLGKGALVDGLDKGVSTALIEAVAKGNAQVVKVLLEHGADIQRRHLDLDQSPKEIAEYLFREEISQMLNGV